MPMNNERYLEKYGDILQSAWNEYNRAKGEGLDDAADEQRAMMIVRPDDSQRSRLLNTCKKRGLWPLEAEPEKGQIDLYNALYQ